MLPTVLKLTQQPVRHVQQDTTTPRLTRHLVRSAPLDPSPTQQVIFTLIHIIGPYFTGHSCVNGHNFERILNERSKAFMSNILFNNIIGAFERTLKRTLRPPAFN